MNFKEEFDKNSQRCIDTIYRYKELSNKIIDGAFQYSSHDRDKLLKQINESMNEIQKNAPILSQNVIKKITYETITENKITGSTLQYILRSESIKSSSI